VMCVHQALLLLTVVLATANSLPQSEINALKDLYHSTNGPKWRKNRWPAKLDGDPCRWAGITCHRGHVAYISHEHTYAGGSLPASIGDLTEVQLLDLGSNMLTGPIPKELGSLKKVFQIEADGNHFTGKVPTELEALTKLRSGPEHRPRSGASAGGARVFLGFNSHPGSAKFGFECPYPAWLNAANPTNRPGTTIATSFGLMKNCGLVDHDATPDEEDTPEGTKQEEFGDGNDDDDDGQDYPESIREDSV